MKTAQLNQLAFDYILSCIDSEGYEVTPKTDKEKINFLIDTFRREYCYPENLRRYGNEINTFAEWCKGLPSAFGIEFENHKILELAVSWGVLSTAASERKKGQILENYWNFISNKAFQLHKKLNKPERLTIYDIKRRTAETSPHFFDRKTLKFFGQRMSMFSASLCEDGRYYVHAPMFDRQGKRIGTTERYFNPLTNELEKA